MTLLVGTHLLVAVAVALTGRRLGARVFLIAAIAPLVTLLYAARHFGAITDGEPITETISWVPSLGLDLTARIDAFSLLFLVLVGGVGLAVFVYSRWYFGPRPDLGRIATVLVLFEAAMLGLVIADNLLLLFVFWELTSITSFLLVGTDDLKADARVAAVQALLVTAGGGLVMLAGLVLLGAEAGTFSLAAIVADPPATTATGVALGLVLVGALTKSAQWPFHFWLPGAMAAPTPISAFLHSATMVKAGIYLIARLAPPFAPLFPGFRVTLMTIGLITMVFGGYQALRRHDLKQLLAYGTVSQLGFLTLLLGAGQPALTFAGVAVLLAHGLFKACVFLVTGIVDHQAHSRDIRRLDAMARALPATFVAGAIGAASMAGIPPMLGFVAKESALEGLLEGGTGDHLALAVVVVASALTAAYAARFVWGGFAPKPHIGEDPPGHTRPAHLAPIHPDGVTPAKPWFVAPALVLAALTVIGGLVPALPNALVAPAAGALSPAAGDGYLVLWHGLTLALGLSLAALAVGALLFRWRDAVEAIQDRLARRRSAADAWAASMRGLATGADRVTGVVQNGSLPVYLAVIVLTAVLLPLPFVLQGTLDLGALRIAESPLQVAAAAAVMVAALAVTLAQRRLAAVLLLGAVGFGVAVLFVIQGAPDLALTQLLIETLIVVVFVLVLRHLPDRFDLLGWRGGQVARIGVALVVGVFVAVTALLSSGARTAPPVSEEHIARALPEGDGSNVVNVILVDFRGFDTLGELTVVVVCAIGMLALVAAGRGRTRRDADPDGDAGDRPGDGSAEATLEEPGAEPVEEPVEAPA